MLDEAEEREGELARNVRDFNVQKKNSGRTVQFSQIERAWVFNRLSVYSLWAQFDLSDLNQMSEISGFYRKRW
jgi:hypothetical protein